MAWEALHDLFGIDDGSLPEIRVRFSRSDAVTSAYALLRARAGNVAPDAPTFWSNVEEAELPLDAVENAAALVAMEEAHPFHVVFGGLRARGVELPELGVFVFPDELCLDYRGGAAWQDRLDALFVLLRELVALDDSASVTLGEGAPADQATRFQQAWLRGAAE